MLTLVVRAPEEHHTVGTAVSGKEALMSIAERTPDLVLLDYRMMGMDGLEAMKALRARPASP